MGPPDQRYQDTAGAYNSQSAEVALFLLQTGDVTDASAPGGAKPLFGLYRRQLLTVPNLPTPQNHWTPAAAVGAGQAPTYVEVSTIPTAGEASAAPNLSFNSLIDLTMPPKRFWMNRGNLAGVSQPTPGNTSLYATMGESNPPFQAADLVMTDVVSMDVRVLVQATNPQGVVRQGSDFEDLFALTNPNRPDPLIPNGKWYFPFNNTGFGGAAVFDTWSSAVDPNNAAYNYTNWQTPGAAGIPIYKDNLGNPISIQAIQITLRVWDFKTKKTRQVTIVQQM